VTIPKTTDGMVKLREMLKKNTASRSPLVTSM
jgi:hypothetical protein